MPEVTASRPALNSACVVEGRSSSAFAVSRKVVAAWLRARAASMATSWPVLGRAGHDPRPPARSTFLIDHTGQDTTHHVMPPAMVAKG